MEITAAMVMALRKKTGLPMMDCKRALSETGGDPDKAIEWLAERGLKMMDKMSDRSAEQGRIACVHNREHKKAGLVELRCETAPVANTDDFIALANLIARHVAVADNPSVDTLRKLPLMDDASRTVGDALDEAFNKIRENIQIARVEQLHGEIASYIHFDGQSGAAVELSGECPEELGAGVCMHITAMRPPVLKREDADPVQVQEQQAKFREEAANKPPRIIEKIVGGKMNRWYSDFVLLEQAYVKDDKKSVGEALAEATPDLTIKRYVRLQVGEA